jgi:hypothetical protein
MAFPNHIEQMELGSKARQRFLDAKASQLYYFDCKLVVKQRLDFLKIFSNPNITCFSETPTFSLSTALRTGRLSSKKNFLETR